MIELGEIVGFSGSGGIAYLIIKNHDGRVEHVTCENTSTVKALDAAFGNVITSAHTVNEEAIKGKQIFYSVGDSGLLEGFTPFNEADPELIKAIQRR